jgi:hypothetical protein
LSESAAALAAVISFHRAGQMSGAVCFFPLASPTSKPDNFFPSAPFASVDV